MATDYLTHLVATDPRPSDTDLVRGCLFRAREAGYTYRTKVDMYLHFRGMIDQAGYSGGLDSRENSISAVTQYYQPIDKYGRAVVRYEVERVLEDDLLIHIGPHGYSIVHS